MKLLTQAIESVLVSHLKELREAETHLRRVLPGVWDSTHNAAVAVLLRRFLQQSTEHNGILSTWVDELEPMPSAAQWAAMEMCILEMQCSASAVVDDGMRDLLIITGFQKIKGLKLAAYGSARSLAEACGRMEMAEVLADILTVEMEGDLELVEVGHQMLHRAQMLAN
ncbi:MAG: hypothetical protein JWO89_1129 [Verrucomicrobiaceae bacterium]|nr:hypothetical protein [Verrucomicrobiaceae bacterium]